MPGKESLKAYVGGGLAALGAGLAAAGTALGDGVITAQEGTVIAGAVVATLVTVFGGVWVTTNSPKQ